MTIRRPYLYRISLKSFISPTPTHIHLLSGREIYLWVNPGHSKCFTITGKHKCKQNQLDYLISRRVRLCTLKGKWKGIYIELSYDTHHQMCFTESRESGSFTPFSLVVTATAAIGRPGADRQRRDSHICAIEPSDHQLHSLTHNSLGFLIFPSKVSCTN